MESQNLDIFEKLFTAKDSQTLIPLLEEITTEITSSSKDFTFWRNGLDKIERLIKKIIKSDTMVDNERILALVMDFLNNSVFSRIDILGLLLNILEFLESEKTGVYKTEYARRKFFERLTIETLVNESSINRFGRDFGNLNEEEADSMLAVIFNLPNKVANYLETCPQELKGDTFYISFYHSFTSNGLTQDQKFVSLVNKMITTAQHSKNLSIFKS